METPDHPQVDPQAGTRSPRAAGGFVHGPRPVLIGEKDGPITPLLSGGVWDHLQPQTIEVTFLVPSTEALQAAGVGRLGSCSSCCCNDRAHRLGKHCILCGHEGSHR